MDNSDISQCSSSHWMRNRLHFFVFLSNPFNPKNYLMRIYVIIVIFENRSNWRFHFFLIQALPSLTPPRPHRAPRTLASQDWGWRPPRPTTPGRTAQPRRPACTQPLPSPTATAIPRRPGHPGPLSQSGCWSRQCRRRWQIQVGQSNLNIWSYTDMIHGAFVLLVSHFYSFCKRWIKAYIQLYVLRRAGSSALD